MIEKVALTEGQALLHQPVLPLVGIVEFIYLTGDFASVQEVIAELPEEIETGYTCYRDPAGALTPYLDLLEPLSALKAGTPSSEQVIDTDGLPVDAMTATGVLVAQRILTRELERINSLLCGPCGCTLCCVGPETDMAQRYFEIPLRAEETGVFPIGRIDSPESRTLRIDHEPPLQADGRDFFDRSEPVLIRWRPGWSLVLPTGSFCPNLEAGGRCRVYPDRPQVCRRPQIFPYVVEPVEEAQPPAFRLRQTLLAVVDCPYVQLLQDEIAAYAAACELEMLFRHNKA
jgi:Fe-S-cluster containining protein